MQYPWHLYLMAFIYVLAGAFHFIKPKLYLRIMPRYLPKHKQLVYLSGVAEIILGFGLCFSVTKNVSIYSTIAMLILFLMVHVYMLTEEKAAAGIPKSILYLRLLLQFGLIYWAYYYLQF